jgi:exonuclease III
MKLISVNIENNKHTETVLDLLAKEHPDVVCMQELLEEQFDFYKEYLGFEGVFQAVNYIKSPINTHVLGKKYGVAIFAKRILDSGSVFYEGSQDNIAKPFDEYLLDESFQNNSALVWVDIEGDDHQIFKCITTHLPVTKEGKVTPYQLQVIDALIKNLDYIGQFVLCGDMNAPRGTESFGRLARKYQDNIPQEYQTSIDQNLHRVKGIQLMVDGLFTTPDYRALQVKLVDGVSDHMAIVAQIKKN